MVSAKSNKSLRSTFTALTQKAVPDEHEYCRAVEVEAIYTDREEGVHVCQNCVYAQSCDAAHNQEDGTPHGHNVVLPLRGDKEMDR